MNLHTVRCPPIILCAHRAPSPLARVVTWAEEQQVFRVAEWHPSQTIEALFEQDERVLLGKEFMAMAAGAEQDPLTWLQHPGELLPNLFDRGLVIVAYVGSFFLLARPTLVGWFRLLAGSVSFRWESVREQEIERLLREEKIAEKILPKAKAELLAFYIALEKLPPFRVWARLGGKSLGELLEHLTGAEKVVCRAVLNLERWCGHGCLFRELRRFGELFEAAAANFRIHLKLRSLRQEGLEKEALALKRTLASRLGRLERYPKPWQAPVLNLTRDLFLLAEGRTLTQGVPNDDGDDEDEDDSED